MKIFCRLIVLIVFPFFILAAPKYPFPQSVKYSYGIAPSNISNDKVQAAYDDFYNRFYEENSDKTMARIKWDTESMTVSEGIGYGMIIMAYMDNTANNTQAKFDKLWKYYNNFLDAKGLMNWKINGFSGVASGGTNAATDADFDAATGLMEAYKQWGEEKYLTDAKVLIGKIWRNEIDNSGLLIAGDAWGSSQINPSYFSTAALKLFQQADASNWNKVIASSYSLLMKARNPATGLLPDWCSNSGQALTQGTFYYDAIRVPWRMAWAYSWDGNDTTKTICSSIGSWIAAKTGGDPGKIVDEYNLDGSNTSRGKKNVGAFVSCLASAGLVDVQHQAWLDAAYKRLQDSLVAVKENYYNNVLKFLNLLLISGNMPNFWDKPVSIASPKVLMSAAKAPVIPLISFDPYSNRLNVTTPSMGVFRIDICNILGQQVIRSFSGRAVNDRVSFLIGKRLQSGIYWARLKTSAGSSVTQIVITP